MDLELRNVQVKDVVLGDKNDLKDGVLTVDVEGLKKLILEDIVVYQKLCFKGSREHAGETAE